MSPPSMRNRVVGTHLIVQRGVGVHLLARSARVGAHRRIGHDCVERARSVVLHHRAELFFLLAGLARVRHESR